MEKFEKATRMKLRFDSTKGIDSLSCEDLWDLPLTKRGGKLDNLDNIAQALYKKISSDETPSFVLKNATSDTTANLKFEIVTHIIDVKLKEKERAENMVLLKEKQQKILAAIENREDAALGSASLEELKAELEAINKQMA